MRKSILSLLLVLTSALSLRAAEGRLLRFPATNGQDVVFSYAGDLYRVPLEGGQAVRLTSHVGYEMFARYSPDGGHIAFTAEYDGNREVYLMSSQGGEPVRLSYTSTNSRDDLGDRMGPNNMVLTWTPDGKSIVYRNRIGDGFEGQLYKISPQGGMPERIGLPEGGFCSFSPDGTLMAYNRVMREFRTWKYYRGGMADDIWIYDQKAGKVTNITNHSAQDIIPMWVGEEIFFLSDRDMTMNIFSYNTRTRQTRKVTSYTDYDVKFPSTDGRIIVYEHAGYIYRLDPSTLRSEKIEVIMDSENPQARARFIETGDEVSDWSISPDGRRMVITARGDIYDVPVEKGVTRNLTQSSESNDRGAVWSADGRWIAWIGDATGETEVYLLDRLTGSRRQLTSGSDTYIRSIYFTPESGRLMLTDRKNRIQQVDLATGQRKTILSCPESEIRGLSFSPDGRWMAYARPQANKMSVVYVMDLNNGKEYAVTEKWYDSYAPQFSTDGKYLLFVSDRDLNPVYSRIEWDYAYQQMSGVYMAILGKDTPSPLMLKDPESPAGGTPKKEAASTGKGKDKAGKSPDGETDRPAETVIDFDGLTERILKLPFQTGSYGQLYSDGKAVWAASRGAILRMSLEDRKVETWAEGTSFSLEDGKTKAVFSKAGKLYTGEMSGGKLSLDDPVDLGQMRARVDYDKEWAQIYDEVWRAFRDGFYLENMHGQDWKAIRAKYAVLLPWVKTRLDLNYVIGEMISEVACGHAYITPGQKPEAERIDMGLLGCTLEKDASGYYRISHILQGAPYSESLRSPLTEPGLDIREGDLIVSVDGESTGNAGNIYALLVGKAGVPTELGIKASKGGDIRKVTVTPIADEYPLYHLEWVQKNIRHVEEASGGKVGYIYIPDMSQDGLNEFVRYYYPQLDKEALIIDDRANGGGNVSPMIIERLEREAYRLTMSRTSSQINTVPDGTHTGPKVMLVNKYSASDGDLFPWSFKAKKMGTVIGTRTWGGIIGITSSLPYQDGTQVNVPFFTNYDAKTGQWIVENHGVDPDIVLDNDPVKEFSGVDEQLDKAIEVALEQIKTRKPLPGVPAPRTLKDLGLPVSE